MKQRLSPFLAVLALAGFLAGGAVAPTLHRVQHAQERYAAQQERCAHGGHDVPAAEKEGAQVELERCWTCTRHLLSTVPSPFAASSALRQEAVRSAVALALHGAHDAGQHVIRGPPGRS